MRHGLPLWCCLNDKSKRALFKGRRKAKFNEPQAIWQEWRTDGHAPEKVDEGIDYDRFMRQPPSRSR